MSDLFPSAQNADKTDAADDMPEENDNELQFTRCNRSTESEQTESSKLASESSELSDVCRDTPHPPNVRRTHLALRYLLLSAAFSLCVAGVVLYCGWRTYQYDILPRLTPQQASARDGDPSQENATAALAKATEQIAALQKQVDFMRREQLLMRQNTRESLERLSNARSETARPAVQEEARDSTTPGTPRFAEARPDISPTQQEFIQLKERNRLIQYADEAIATGMRHPLEVLVEYMRDPQSKHLHEAAQAEYMRAVRAIQLLQREDPGYRLPVADLFKDAAIRDEADVKPEALLRLLADTKQAWEVRVRVCFLLLGSPLPQTDAALLKAIKEDPSLEVAKHAQLALEQRLKRRFRIFDIPAIEAWMKTRAH